MEPKILVVDDEKNILDYIAKGLKEENYAVDIARDGTSALEYGLKYTYNVIILDVMLPEIDGIQVCAKLREKGVKSYIIMLTAKDKINDKIVGLDAGADDYITKPFAFSELLARIKAILRRDTGNKKGMSILRAKDLELNLLEREARRNGKKIELTSKEFLLLEYFIKNKNQLLTRSMIAEKVWNLNFVTESNIIDVYVNHLRVKVDKGFDDKLIETMRGVGYILRA